MLSQSCVPPLLKALEHNSSLVSLNLSLNRLGNRDRAHPTNDGQLCLELLCRVLRRNSTLQHIDLSYCNFDGDECNELAQALRENRTIVGIHFAGNAFTVDTRMFLVDPDDVDGDKRRQAELQAARAAAAERRRKKALKKNNGKGKGKGRGNSNSSGNNNNRGSSRGNTKRPPTGKKPTTARPSTSPSQTASFKSLTVSLQRKHSDEPLQFGKPTSIVHVQGKLRTNPIKIETVDHTLRMMYDQKLTMNSSDKSNNKTNKGNNTRGRRSGAYHERQPKHRRTLTDANKWVNNPMVQLYIERNRTTPALVEDLAEPQKPDALALAMTKRLATFVNGYEGPQVWDPPPVVSDNNNGHALLSHRTSNGSVGSNTTTTMTTAAVPSTLNNNNVNNSEENQDENDSGEYTGPTTVGDVAACQCWLCRPCTVMEFSFTPGVSTLRVRVVWLPLLMTGIL